MTLRMIPFAQLEGEGWLRAAGFVPAHGLDALRALPRAPPPGSWGRLLQ